MGITREMTVLLASAQVGDSYDVELTVTDPRTLIEVTVSLSTGEAVQLARELLAVVGEAEAALAYDVAGRMVQTVAHAFDLAPSCRDCREGGKHSACIGSAWIERGSEIDEVECGCAKAGHPNIVGGEA